MMIKHTPGPWKFGEFGDDTVRAENWGIVAWLSIKRRIHLDHREMALKNARLVAAAPELLAALETALPWLEVALAGGFSEKLAEIRAVIAKARGDDDEKSDDQLDCE